MSFFEEQVRAFGTKLSALIPFGKQKEEGEYYFALDISLENITVALWTIDGRELKIIETDQKSYTGLDQITEVTDSLLNAVLGVKEIEPQKILFGVPNNWLSDDNLKDEYLKLLRGLVRDLELTPLAYVATTHAINHLLEKQDGIPQTAILVGFEKNHLTVMVTRAGKIDGVKILKRGDNSGADIEKALLTFTDVETLPSKIFIYGQNQELLSELKGQLLSFPWMAKLSFLHFPKVEILPEELEIKSICLAGASELKEDVIFKDVPVQKREGKVKGFSKDEIGSIKDEEKESVEKVTEGDNFGFVVGDISEQLKEEIHKESLGEISEDQESTALSTQEDSSLKENTAVPVVTPDKFRLASFKKIIVRWKHLFLLKRNSKNTTILLGLVGIIVVLIGAYLFLVKAQVKVFVEPKILEKDAQVVADPKQKEVDMNGKIIPGQIIETEVSGTAKDQATGKKQIGDPAKGTIILRNKTDGAISISKGMVLNSSNGLKFNLDLSVTIASRSAEDGTWGKATATVTASLVGADGNLPSGTDLTVSGQSTDKVIAKSEGNFSGGTSQEVTAVSSEDQKRLLASLASTLRKQAQQKLQEELGDKKILEEALSEQILRKDYSKNVNDQASEFSLNMTIRFKGTAFDDKDLKGIVGTLVTTEVPEGFELNLQDTETQADVAKLETDGRLVFLARFRSKLMPKIDKEKIKDQIRGKTVIEAAEKLKSMEGILASEFQIKPTLPSFLQRLPLIKNNIAIEVGLK